MLTVWPEWFRELSVCRPAPFLSAPLCWVLSGWLGKLHVMPGTKCTFPEARPGSHWHWRPAHLLYIVPAHLPSFYLWTSSDLQTVGESLLEMWEWHLVGFSPVTPKRGFLKALLLNIKQKYPGHTDMVETEGTTNL